MIKIVTRALMFVIVAIGVSYGDTVMSTNDCKKVSVEVSDIYDSVAYRETFEAVCNNMVWYDLPVEVRDVAVGYMKKWGVRIKYGRYAFSKDTNPYDHEKGAGKIIDTGKYLAYNSGGDTTKILTETAKSYVAYYYDVLKERKKAISDDVFIRQYLRHLHTTAAEAGSCSPVDCAK